MGVAIGTPFHAHRLDPPGNLTTRMEQIAWLWSEINSVILRDLAAIQGDRKFEFRLGNTGPETFKDLLDFLGCDYSDEHLKQMATIAEMKPNEGVLEAGMNVEWDERRFQQITARIAQRLGYAI